MLRIDLLEMYTWEAVAFRVDDGPGSQDQGHSYSGELTMAAELPGGTASVLIKWIALAQKDARAPGVNVYEIALQEAKLADGTVAIDRNRRPVEGDAADAEITRVIERGKIPWMPDAAIELARQINPGKFGNSPMQ